MSPKHFFLFLIPFLAGLEAAAQSVYAPLNRDYYHLIDRFEIKNRRFADGFFSHVKPFQRQGIVQLTDSIIANDISLSDVDQFNLQYLRNDSWEWAVDSASNSKKPFLKYLYRKKSDLYHVKTRDFDLHLSPVLDMGFGYDNNLDDVTFINTRGIELRGIVDGKVGFYSFLGENQARFPEYVQSFTDSLGAVPNEGFWKRYKNDGVDFFTARGYIAFNFTRHIQTQFGYDKNVIGPGHRTFILSDFSSNYLFWKINTKVWRLNYMNLFTKMVADVSLSGTGVPRGSTQFPDKYMSLHHLSINITDNINLGIFEAVIWGRADSLGSNPFKLEYLNPIIFFRAIEQQGGSPDNVLLGFDFKWNFLRHFSAYGQFVLDEFLLENLSEGNGWWGNKYSFQLGLKYIDVFNVPNLDLLLEYNQVRPYTYSHESNFTNYSNYKQSLAHPLGANFKEFVTVARYQPYPRLSLTGKFILNQKGEDDTGTNWGGNILKDFNTREQEFGNETTQGVQTDLMFFDLRASYQLKHNFFVDVRQVFRDLDSEIDSRDTNTSYTSLAFRLNIARRQQDF